MPSESRHGCILFGFRFVERVGGGAEETSHPVVGAFVMLAFELTLDLFFEDQCVIVRVAAGVVLVEGEGRDCFAQSLAGLSPHAESRSVHRGDATAR